jgi:hypothetical protein
LSSVAVVIPFSVRLNQAIVLMDNG